jgi:hypothetical protein
MEFMCGANPSSLSIPKVVRFPKKTIQNNHMTNDEQLNDEQSNDEQSNDE